MKELSHYDADGAARMVDVGGKPATRRRAVAEAFVRLSREVIEKLPENPKGDPLEIARIAGIQGAKKTAELIPLCHPLPLTYADVEIRLREDGVEIRASAETEARTGVEMEALTAAATAALTVYDMCKALDKSIEITGLRLLEKTGGTSGDFRRNPTTSTGVERTDEQ